MTPAEREHQLTELQAELHRAVAHSGRRKRYDLAVAARMCAELLDDARAEIDRGRDHDLARQAIRTVNSRRRQLRIAGGTP